MKHFARLRSGIDCAPVLDEIGSLENAWDRATGRQSKVRVQREALSIPLRGRRMSAAGDVPPRDVQESRWTTLSRAFPHTRAFLKTFASAQDGALGRAKLVCLPPGHRGYPHIDRGLYYLPRDRYHLILQSPRGSFLRAGDESVCMAEGELWWFDNKQEHESVNDGDLDRIHLIFDRRPARSTSTTEAVAPSERAAS
ncbi:aspartyl/asparaginyl beta-hydroxylase domain-containing protein [Roseospira navarrensis]|uniref:Aspartyl/asparaginy/proline hydroxylase domain-containing protein n=1 Tax=Roseospira navarrensis TaxID=140058 RepID=A0A7X1ZDP3_9PROT|nr:aspartyl/asparaginyl beta-hydroxylase domain-containing protein [Roseospira navarrensis]MQX35310.1 hypothetical protein [Roseospira navarrensis]